MKLRILAYSLLLAIGSSFSAHAYSCLPVLLTIDDCDPCAVVITATGSYSAVNDCSTTLGDGVDLLSFFQDKEVETDPQSRGGLTPNGSYKAYNCWSTDDASCSEVDLNLFNSKGGKITQDFSECDSAFTGCWTINLSEFACDLPSDGETGEILAGYSRHEGSVIGLWQVVNEVVPVPEPSQYGLFAFLGLAALVAQRKFSRSRQAVTVR